ncbi:MAG TPA: tetratricopeptide repeat protein [Candidatus Udaeobacter sp.]|nr:tetratricopeptide repeat protein [Candidatus Udaeobacter sp.]
MANSSLPDLSRRLAGMFSGLAVLAGLLLGSAAGADSTGVSAGNFADMLPSPLGHYLASRHAQSTGDLDAAADLLSLSLASDPDNPQLLQTCFDLMLDAGRLPEAVDLAKRLEQAGSLNGVDRVTLAIDRAKAGDFAAADLYLLSIRGEGLEHFLNPMLRAWTQLAAVGLGGAEKALEPLGAINGFQPLYELQLGLIADVGGKPDEAKIHYYKALDLANERAFRLIQLVANFRLRQGHPQAAAALYDTFEQEHPGSFLVEPLRRAMKEAGKPKPIVGSPLEGMAESLYQLAGLLESNQSSDAALTLVRLALDAHPDDPIYLSLLAETLDSQSQTAAALAVFRQVPPDGLYGWEAQIKVADELHKLGRDDEAVATLQKLIDSQPGRAEAAIELGDVLRSASRFTEAVKAYDTAIARIGKLPASDWSLYYFRGIALERSDQWPKAELDFKKALELQPNQPYVLNYLGYTWVDKGVHLDEAMAMLKRAVDQKPDDGYIVDSLAWAYYRLGNYDKAVIYQEKAISLDPSDSVLNDHLGDIYWKLGRRDEARFQWQRALAFKPDADRVAPIEAKLQRGLDAGGTGG